MEKKIFVAFVSLWLIPGKPGRINLVHGDHRAQTALARVLKEKGYKISVAG